MLFKFLFMRRDKRQKFIELANRRVNRAIREIRLIGNLSNASAYEYGEEDYRKIQRALQRELDFLRSRFTSRGTDASNEFSL